jgi:23S rRNA pseudouridine1911/1915/1917 synthase
MVVAKTEQAKNKLALQFFEKTTERRYQAMVWGIPKENEGTITGNIGRSLKNRQVFTVFPDEDYGKHAVTHYKVLKEIGYVSLVECRLETGRTHQIRVHMKYINHPLFNDSNYGGDQILRGTTFTKYKQFVQNCFKLLPRQALHAKTLGFEHPVTGEKMLFDSELPEDMTVVIKKWENYIATEMIKKPNIAVIAGGDSSEFVVSVKSGANVLAAIDTQKFRPWLVQMRGDEWFVLQGEKQIAPVDKSDFSFS